jgi:hypothetical protein
MADGRDMSDATFLPRPGLGVTRNTAHDAVLAEGRRVLIDDLHRF